ncbi:hypothetical protein IPM19_04690 [bacterium]|nr:MAG: hypothetical protein IPM19_04690 [bacterium]
MNEYGHTPEEAEDFKFEENNDDFEAGRAEHLAQIEEKQIQRDKEIKEWEAKRHQNHLMKEEESRLRQQGAEKASKHFKKKDMFGRPWKTKGTPEVPISK